MFALRWMTGAATVVAGCGLLAGAAHARIVGDSGSLIAYERNGDIRVMSADATTADVNITNTAGVAESAVSWARPDLHCLRAGVDTHLESGRSLVYESRPNGADSDIVLAHVAGYPPSYVGDETLTGPNAVDDGAPSVGDVTDALTDDQVPVIVFTRGPVGQRDIWGMLLDGSQQTRLTFGAGDEFEPELSSDGRFVVFQTLDDAGRSQLAVIDFAYDSGVPALGAIDPPQPRLITAGPEQHGSPSWFDAFNGNPASDPSRIVHVSTFAGAPYLDFIEHPTPTTGELFAPAAVPAPLVRQLTGDPGGDLAPRWRSEGDIVVFESDRAQPGNRDIYRIAADGTQLVRLTQDPAADRAPDWEPIGAGCLDPEPYAPRPGTQTRSGKKPPPPQSTPPPPPAPRTGPSLRVSQVRITKSGKGRRRVVTVRFNVNVAARGTMRLRRGKRVVARRIDQRLPAGSARMRMSVSRTARGGSHKLRLKVTAGSTSRTIERNVRIRSLARRR